VDPPPGNYNQSITLDNQLATRGVYCSTGTITFGRQGHANNFEYDVTAVAPSIVITGNHETWCPFYQSTGPNYCDQANGANLVLWVTGPDAGGGTDLSFTDQNSQVNGVMWDEGGNINYGANSGGFGFWEAQNITFDGNHYQMVGTGPPITGPPGTTTVTTLIPGSTTVPVTIPTSTVGTTTVTIPDSTSDSVSTGTVTGPDTTSTSESTNTIIIPGTSGNTTTTVKTVGTNLALNQ
jgi:hypothetical protein